jgi:putative glutathione S-transferase
VHCDTTAPINAAIGLASRADNKDHFDYATKSLHTALQKMETKLAKHRFLCGEEISEADVIEFVTLVRFDALMSPAFVINNKPLTLHGDFPNISGWLRDIFQIPGKFNHARFCQSFLALPLLSQTLTFYPFVPHLTRRG